jgi:hypothetical protein
VRREGPSWHRQAARWPSNRELTSAGTPSQPARKRFTSARHSLKPARYLPRTAGSALRTAAGTAGTSGRCPWLRLCEPSAPQIMPPVPHLSPARDAGSVSVSQSSPGCLPSPISSGESSGGRDREMGCSPAAPHPPRLKLSIPPCPVPAYILPERIQDEGLELSEAFVDARSAPLLHDRLGGLQVEQRMSSAFRGPPNNRPPPYPAPGRDPLCGVRLRCGAYLGSGWRWPVLQRAARLSAFPECLRAWCALRPQARRSVRDLRWVSAPRPRAEPTASYLRPRRGGVCEPR